MTSKKKARDLTKPFKNRLNNWSKNIYKNRCSISLIIREILIKDTIRCF